MANRNDGHESRLKGFGFLLAIALLIALSWFVFGDRFAATPDQPSAVPPSATPEPR